MPTKIFDKVIIGNSLDDLSNKCLIELNKCDEVSSRLGDNTKELIGMSTMLTDPKNTWMLSKERKHNIFHQIGESLGVLSGHLDMSYLVKFLPGAKAFSDDYNEETKTGHWRADYAGRIRHFKGIKANSYYKDPGDLIEIDQLKNVYEELKAHPNTRRAVIALWSPVDDGTFPDSLDYPCNDLIQFIVRDNKLNMIVTVRSNDEIWGYTAINMIEFPLMQRLMASALGLEVGVYKHQAGSFHIYDKHYDRANAIVKEYESFDFTKCEDKDNISEFEKVWSFDTVDSILQAIYTLEMTSRHVIEGLELPEEEYNNPEVFYNTLDKVKELSSVYPNIIGTFMIPLIYKRSPSDYPACEFLDIINKAKLHPALKLILDEKIEKMKAKALER